MSAGFSTMDCPWQAGDAQDLGVLRRNSEPRELVLLVLALLATARDSQVLDFSHFRVTCRELSSTKAQHP